MSTAPTLERRLCLLAFAACAALHLWFVSVGWRNNLLEGHEFRQTQTALNIEYLLKDGWSLAYPLPLFGPPWSAPMEFPLYQTCAAAVVRATGLAIEPAGRLVSLAFFYAALPALFLLLRELRVPPHRRWLFLAALLVSPLYLYYSRTVMIESTALGLSAWFLLGYVRGLTPGHGRWLAVAAVCGLAGALAKVTTLMVFLSVAAVWTLARLADQWQHRPDRWLALRGTVLRALTATVPAVAVGTAWVHYSDAIKLSNPLATFLASGPMTAFNFGTLAQRYSPSFWVGIAGTTAASVLPAFNLAVLLGLAVLVPRGQRARLAWLLLGFVAGPLLLANLYFIHDYYFYATGLFLIGALAFTWHCLLDHPRVPAVATWLLITVCLGLEAHRFTQGYFWFQKSRRPDPPELARVLATITGPEDVVLIYGLEWNPVVPYYSGRRVIMVTNQYFDDHERRNTVIGRLPPGRIAALVAVGPNRLQADFFRLLARSLRLREEPLITSPNAHVYVAEQLAATAGLALASVPFHEFTLQPPTDAAGKLQRRQVVVADLADTSVFDMMQPRPVEAVVPFGLTVNLLDGHRVFSAHSPTDLIFDPPAGAHTLHAGFGVLPGAYQNGNAVERVRFLIELVRPNGERVRLFDRYLSPAHVVDDRGTHTADVTLPAATSGRVVFRTLPGPDNNISYHWAYWTDILIK